MQKEHLRKFFIIGAALALAAFCSALPAFARAESISAFDARFTIQKDGTVQAVE